MSVRNWGEKVWEDKIKGQNETAVVFGWGSSKYGIDRQTRKIEEIIKKEILPALPKNALILDAGVGPWARFSIFFAKSGYRVMGLDISPSTIKIATKHIKVSNISNVELKKGDITSFIDKRKYNLVFCVETFFHVPIHLGLLTLRNFNQMLHTGDLALIGISTRDDKSLIFSAYTLYYLAIYHVLRRAVRSSKIPPTVVFYTEEEFTHMIELTGFKLVKTFSRRSTTRNNLWLLKKVKDVKSL
jgi:2-polyprenyl-3-methyl-5-hydroxy-6-metoxy-1,4-benzoquinol methylase